jgi:hypothetical protein
MPSNAKRETKLSDERKRIITAIGVKLADNPRNDC